MSNVRVPLFWWTEYPRPLTPFKTVSILCCCLSGREVFKCRMHSLHIVCISAGFFHLIVIQGFPSIFNSVDAVCSSPVLGNVGGWSRFFSKALLIPTCNDVASLLQLGLRLSGYATPVSSFVVFHSNQGVANEHLPLISFDGGLPPYLAKASCANAGVFIQSRVGCNGGVRSLCVWRVPLSVNTTQPYPSSSALGVSW